jgi:prevent-host-death family protein
MDILSATEARTKLYRLIDETAESHKPVVIKGQRNSAVLISLEDWNGIQETLEGATMELERLLYKRHSP